MRTAVVFGAAGYVGTRLIRRLAASGLSVTAVTRPNGALLLQNERVEHIIDMDEVRRVPRPDVVVNLAYPTGDVWTQSIDNKRLANAVGSACGPHTRVIHASTQAVFGYGLEHPLTLSAVPLRRDRPYIEDKLQMEWLLARDPRIRSLDVVRLGNVWGPASPTWTVNLIDRISFAKPVGISGTAGYSNVTDVANAVDYFTFLAQSDAHGLRRYHHLAELSPVRWPFWIGRLAHRLGMQAITLSELPPHPTWRGTLTKVATSATSAILRQVVEDPRAFSILRDIVSRIPRNMRLRLLRNAMRSSFAASNGQVRDDDIDLLTILAGQREFVTRTLDGWVAPVSVEQSWAAVADGMSEAGY